jgi:two-component system, response regulator PdtaR
MNPPAKTSSGSFMIVIAEDEPLIRMMTAEVLTDAGFEIMEAEHAEAALAILNLQASEVDVLFTDIHMPGSMDGLALAHHIRRHWPWIRLLLTSGRAAPTPADIPPGSRFLPKPYQPAHVLAHVQELTTAQ